MDYTEIEALLMRTDCQYTPAEVQGISCGMLAIDLNCQLTLWVKHIFEGFDEKNVLHQDKKNELKIFWDDTRTNFFHL